MPILVTTAGPVSGSGTLWGANLRNFNDMVAALADEIDDSQDDYTPQIHHAIFAALRFCAREPFYFNEARDVVFDTIAGQAWYDATHHKEIGTLAGLSAVICQRITQGQGITQGQAWALRCETPKKLEILDTTQRRGAPSRFCYFGQKLRLYPRPDTNGYRIRLQISPRRFEELKDGAQESLWFVEAFDLIFARAKYELYKNTLKDVAAAAASLGDFQEQLHSLRAETSRRRNGGFVKPTLF